MLTIPNTGDYSQKMFHARRNSWSSLRLFQDLNKYQDSCPVIKKNRNSIGEK